MLDEAAEEAKEGAEAELEEWDHGETEPVRTVESVDILPESVEHQGEPMPRIPQWG